MSTVLLSLAAALALAAGTVAEHRGATDAAADPDGGLVRRLLRQRIWLAGQALAVVGFLLSALALRGGRLVVVQPLLSSGLVMALVIGALVDRRHPGRPLPDRVQWSAAVAVAIGLSVFLLAARPASGVAAAPFWTTTLCAAAALAAGGAAMLYARNPARGHRAFVYGLVSGLAFGMAGVLLKELVGSDFGRWQAWATLAELGAVGGLAILLAQLGFQAGPLVQSLPVATVVEPVVAVALSAPLFAEYLATGALARAGQVLGALVLVGGIAVLARRTAAREGPPASLSARPDAGPDGPGSPRPPRSGAPGRR
jgi:hypothetical protein